MKKIAMLSLMVGLIFHNYALRAEEPVNSSEKSASTTAVSPEPAREASPAPVTETPEPPAAASTTPAVSTTATSAAVNPAPATSENLEFVSGEIAAVDTAAKTVTVKLYGETENATNDKVLTIKLDETTDITDGEKDRDIKSLTNGTEVDVEYDPAMNKATYIFVY